MSWDPRLIPADERASTIRLCLIARFVSFSQVRPELRAEDPLEHGSDRTGFVNVSWLPRNEAGMSLGVGWKTPTLAAVLWVVALTVWATVAAGVIKGPLGLLIGAVLTALAAVTAGYVPGIREAVLRRRAQLAQLEANVASAREALRRASELPGGGQRGC
jgi:hypothetical protein